MSDRVAPLVVVMGVSGSGKSTIGAILAATLGVPFTDADDLHPASNVAKMAAAVPLADDDRWPWLALVGKALDSASGSGLVVACSALKLSYRAAILAEAPEAVFVHLTGPRSLLAGRLSKRAHHFMPASLLDSQLAALEPLGANEPGFEVEISGEPAELVEAIVRELPER